MSDIWVNILSGAVGALVTGGLGFIVVQQQFREQQRQRKQAIYGELLGSIEYLRRRLAVAAAKTADPRSLSSYFEEEIQGLVQQMFAVRFVASPTVTTALARFFGAQLERFRGTFDKEDMEQLQARLSTAPTEVERAALAYAHYWGEDQSLRALELVLLDDAGSLRWSLASWIDPDSRSVLELMGGRPRRSRVNDNSPDPRAVLEGEEPKHTDRSGAGER